MYNQSCQTAIRVEYRFPCGSSRLCIAYLIVQYVNYCAIIEYSSIQSYLLKKKLVKFKHKTKNNQGEMLITSKNIVT